MRRSLLSLALALAALSSARADAPTGAIEDGMYFSPTGLFKIAIPILPELGGTINDTENVVTFQDEYTMHVSIAAIVPDAKQRQELATRGKKDYLTYFFGSFMLADFNRSFPDTKIESAQYLPDTLGGSVLVYLLIPGGTMFGHRLYFTDDDHPPVAKRANLLFLRGGRVFILSTELAERATEGHAYHKTTAEEDALLLQRLRWIVGRMQFLVPADTPPAVSK